MTVLSFEQLLAKVESNKKVFDAKRQSERANFKANLIEKFYGNLDLWFTTELNKINSDSTELPSNIVLQESDNFSTYYDLIDSKEINDTLVEVGQQLSDKYMGKLGYPFSYKVQYSDAGRHVLECTIDFNGTTEPTEEDIAESARMFLNFLATGSMR